MFTGCGGGRLRDATERKLEVIRFGRNNQEHALGCALIHIPIAETKYTTLTI